MKFEEIRDKDIPINDLEALKVIADPLRTQIMEILQLEPLTVKQIADKLGLTPSKLYYHINMLEKHNFIQVIETRMVANLQEKIYQATGGNLRIDHDLLNFTTVAGKENINQLLISTLDATREDVLRTLQARAYELDQGLPENPRVVLFNRYLSHIPESRADEFRDRLRELMQEFAEAHQDTQPDTANPATYAMMIGFYPSYYFAENAPEKTEL